MITHLSSDHHQGTAKTCKLERSGTTCGALFPQKSPFEILPDIALLHISTFLRPPEMHALCLSYRRIMTTSTNEFSKQTLDRTILHQNPPTEAVPNNSRVLSSLRDTLLHSSQATSLKSVLKESGLQEDQIIRLVSGLRKINAHQHNLILLSGSTLVKTLTGLAFEAQDKDLFLDMRALTQARTMLLDMDMVLHDIRLVYDEWKDFGCNNISHAEIYIPRSEAGKLSTVRKQLHSTLRLRRRMRQADYSRNSEHVHRLNRSDVIRSLQHDIDLPEHLPITARAKLPDIRKTHIIELIVAKDTSNAQDLLDHFDFSICASSFNGMDFTCVNEAATYSQPLPSTKWDSPWKELISHHIPCLHGILGDGLRGDIPLLRQVRLSRATCNQATILRLMSSFSSTCLNHHLKLPCLRHGFGCNCQVLHEINTAYLITLHNKIMRQFVRALKYIKRGVRITDSDHSLLGSLLTFITDYYSSYGSLALPVIMALDQTMRKSSQDSTQNMDLPLVQSFTATANTTATPHMAEKKRAVSNDKDHSTKRAKVE